MEELIDRFYAAFDRKDGDAMAACYAPDARFSDPAFGELRGDGARRDVADAHRPGARPQRRAGRARGRRDTGSARWIARYTFTQTGRPVANDVRARFRFRDGLIAEHDDAFSFHRWARQALGPPGLLLGWTPVLRASVRKRARGNLERFMAGA